MLFTVTCMLIKQRKVYFYIFTVNQQKNLNCQQLKKYWLQQLKKKKSFVNIFVFIK